MGPALRPPDSRSTHVLSGYGCIIERNCNQTLKFERLLQFFCKCQLFKVLVV